MQGSTADMRELASTILQTPTPLTADEQALVRAAYRELAKGAPVTPAHLARAAQVPADAVTAAIARLPGLAQLDAEGRIFGFLGLTLRETPHRFVVAGRTLYTWCAWDTLFIPRVLDAEAHVESRCPITGRPIRLEITSHGVASVVPSEALMSFQVECEPGALASLPRASSTHAVATFTFSARRRRRAYGTLSIPGGWCWRSIRRGSLPGCSSTRSSSAPPSRRSLPLGERAGAATTERVGESKFGGVDRTTGLRRTRTVARGRRSHA